MEKVVEGLLVPRRTFDGIRKRDFGMRDLGETAGALGIVMPALEKLPLFDLFRCPAQQARRKVDTGEITKARQSASRIAHQVLITVQVQHLTGITLFEHPLMDTSQLIEAGFIRRNRWCHRSG
ncbi:MULTISPECIES: hypothetical protein [unclassified Pseudomonas]|uniref:hypothetical protein n=1 Tax=unclassified Pseudomonas TaxID=196821 RepID=UPI002114E806|nr:MULTISPECIES: hypothetical protein [unclassified Pseudomonas]